MWGKLPKYQLQNNWLSRASKKERVVKGSVLVTVTKESLGYEHSSENLARKSLGSPRSEGNAEDSQEI